MDQSENEKWYFCAKNYFLFYTFCFLIKFEKCIWVILPKMGKKPTIRYNMHFFTWPEHQKLLLIFYPSGKYSVLPNNELLAHFLEYDQDVFFGLDQKRRSGFFSSKILLFISWQIHFNEQKKVLQYQSKTFLWKILELVFLYLNGVPFHAVIVFWSGPDLLFKSILIPCGQRDSQDWCSKFFKPFECIIRILNTIYSIWKFNWIHHFHSLSAWTSLWLGLERRRRKIYEPMTPWNGGLSLQSISLKSVW